eukprot:355396_1
MGCNCTKDDAVESKGLRDVEEKKDCLLVTSNNGKEQFKITSLEISPQTDEFDEKSNMTGMIIYAYDGKTEGEINGIPFKSGDIYLFKTDNLNGIESKPHNTAHANVFKKVFGVDIDYSKNVGGGFSYYGEVEKEKKWLYRSYTFNYPDNIDITDENGNSLHDDWHDHNKEMNELEQKFVRNAIKSWIETKERIYNKPAVLL